MRTYRPGRAYAICAGIGLLMTLGVLASRQLLQLTDPLEILGALCDGFFVPGILFLCFGLLVLVSGTGQFDMLSYGMHSLLVLFTPFKKVEKHDSFYDFKLLREARRKEKPRMYLLHMGGIFLGMALICLAMYALQGGL